MSTDLPLAGITVLDLSHFVAGPWCTMLLADLGAEVVKVEPPGSGEIGRNMGGVYAGAESAIFLGFNRNKRSLALDLKREEARPVVHRLADRSDVVVHNLRPGTPERLGIDHRTLRAVNQRLVYCGISAFGETGPYASRPANDPIIQALSGAMLSEERGGGRPVRMGVPLPDFASGILAAIAITAALRRRQHTGKGCVVGLSLLGAQMYALLDRLPVDPAARRAARWSGAYQCADGRYLELEDPDADGDVSWLRLCHALGRTEWAERAPAERRALVSKALASRPCADWVAELDVAGIPCAPVNSLSEAFMGTRGLTFAAGHTVLGELTMLRTPIDSDPPWAVPGAPPPLLGEHTADVLAEAGYDAEAIAALVRDGVVAQAPTAALDPP